VAPENLVSTKTVSAPSHDHLELDSTAEKMKIGDKLGLYEILAPIGGA